MTRAAVWGMWGKVWGMPWGIKSLIHKGCGACGVSRLTGACARTGKHAPQQTHACVCMQVRTPTPHAPHTPHIQQLRQFHAPQHAPHIPHTPFLKGSEMGETKRVIACTEENATQMRAVVRQWPALHGLVTGLQAQGLFPGLRGLSVNLSGDAAVVAKGLDALTGPEGMLAACGKAQGAGEGACN